MSTLVLFDIAEEQPRKRAREVLARLGFARVCPNVYERHHATPTPREVARAVAGVLRGAVFLLRVYGLAARTQIVLRYGSGRGARRAAAKPNNAAKPGTATDGAPQRRDGER